MKGVYLWFSIVVLSLTGISGCKSIGQNPRGEALSRLDTFTNYKNGAFENLAERADSTIRRNLMFRSRPKTIRPSKPLPWVRTDLRTLAYTTPTVVWFGHSSVLIKTIQGNILIDPIFSNHAGPVPGIMKAFPGTMNYRATDMPPIDVLIISHDHYDHMDFRTVKALKNKVKMVVVPLGVGASLVYWGYDPKKIIELNWTQSATLPGGLQITAEEAQHRSNRTYKSENKTLWASFIIQAGNYKLFYGGDGGYGPQLKQIGDKYGPFDLALLECGQYSPNWPWAHLNLGVPAQAAVDLKARLLQPIHWAKFVESDHPWNEPVKKLIPAAENAGIPLTIPRIGEPHSLGDAPKQKVWWDIK